MDRPSLFKRIRKLLIRTDMIADGMRSGNFRSAFKGRGAEFSEVRDYSDRDDARSIDWNVSARMGRPFVRVYQEERELCIFLMLDSSASMGASAQTLAGGETQSPFDLGATAAALLAWSAVRNGDRVGFCSFDSNVGKWFGPRKGNRHVLSLIRAMASLRATGLGSDPGLALRSVRRSMKKRGIIILISDFLCSGWEDELALAANSHDLILLRVAHPMEPTGSDNQASEPSLPRHGSFSLQDPETKEKLLASFGSSAFRAAYTQWATERCRLLRSRARARGASILELGLCDDPVAKLIDFFSSARRRG